MIIIIIIIFVYWREKTRDDNTLAAYEQMKLETCEIKDGGHIFTYWV